MKEILKNHKKLYLYIMWFVFIGLIEICLWSSLLDNSITNLRYSKERVLSLHELSYIFLLFPYILYDYIRRKIVGCIPSVWFRLCEVTIWFIVALCCVASNHIEWYEIFFAPFSKVFLLFTPMLLVAFGVGFVKRKVLLRCLLLLLLLILVGVAIYGVMQYYKPIDPVDRYGGYCDKGVCYQ